MDEISILNTFKENEEADLWGKLFFEISVESEREAVKLDLNYDVSNDDENFEKNRYRNVLPYDHNRVILKLSTGNADYINASHLQTPFNERSYILTQGPLPNTQDDFWQMVYEQNSSIIVMLSKIFENGQLKCNPYFPSSVQQKRLHLKKFTCLLLEETEKENYTFRLLELTINKSKYADCSMGGSSKIISHFQYNKWPDFETPESSQDFLDFLDAIRSCWRQSDKRETCPVICHCSAGIGRTGCFVVVDTLINILERRSELNESLLKYKIRCVEDLIVFMRRYRMGLIQNQSQLRFCLIATRDWIKNRLIRKSDDHTDAVNLSNKSLETVSGDVCSIQDGIFERLISKKLNPEQEKRKELVEEMVKKMREFDSNRNMSVLRKFFTNNRFSRGPWKLAISSACVALISLGIHYYFFLKK